MDEELGFGVKGGGGLVEDENGEVPENHAGDDELRSNRPQPDIDAVYKTLRDRVLP